MLLYEGCKVYVGRDRIFKLSLVLGEIHTYIEHLVLTQFKG
jgi:hypothetical protein